MKKRILLLVLSVFFLSSCMDFFPDKVVTSISVKLKDGVTVYQGDNFNKYRDAFIGTFYYEDGSTMTFNPLNYYDANYSEECKDLSFLKGFYTDTLGKKSATYLTGQEGWCDGDWQTYSKSYTGRASFDFEVVYTEYAFYNGELMSYNGSKTDVVIPSIIDGQNVTKIGYGAFKNKNITSVTIPETVTTISPYAFADNKNLKTITLPSSLKTIGENAFENNGISDIIIPQGVKTIKDNAFLNNTIDTIIIPNSVEEIGLHSFYSLPTYTKIKNLTIPSKFMETINNYFYERPENITYID